MSPEKILLGHVWFALWQTRFFLANVRGACFNEAEAVLNRKEGVSMCKVNYPVYSVSAVANCILDQGKAQQLEITNLKLQKFAYFAQGWALARLDHPLFNEEIQAWTYGPVIPYLYAQAKKYENRPITGLFSAPDIVEPGSDEESIIGDVLATLGKLTAMQLVTLSHEPQSPWQAAWNHGKYTRIPLWQMALYFRDKLGVAAPCE